MNSEHVRLTMALASPLAIGTVLSAPEPTEARPANPTVGGMFAPAAARANDKGVRLFEVKAGDRVGSFNLCPGWHTAREIAAMIPGSTSPDENSITVGTARGPVSMHVLDVLEIIRRSRGSRRERRALRHRKG